MTREEKLRSVAVYLAKVVDHLQGNEDERKLIPPYRHVQAINIGIAQAISETSSLPIRSESQAPLRAAIDTANEIAESEE